MHLNLAVMLNCTCVATGAVAQDAGVRGQKSKFASGDEPRQISRVMNPSAFNFLEKVRWGAKLSFAPAAFRTIMPLYVYNADGGIDCGSSTGGALVDGNYRITKLDWSSPSSGETSAGECVSRDS